MLNMKTVGISISIIEQMNGRSTFNQVFFENVRVPANQVIGEVNRGWYAATTTLDFERSGIGFVVGAERTLEKLFDFTREATADGARLVDRPGVRAKLADLQVSS